MIKWDHKETRDSEIAKFTVGQFVATVQDCDGDLSVWSIHNSFDNCIVGQGKSSSYDPYHFDVAKQQCQAALIIEAKKHNLFTE